MKCTNFCDYTTVITWVELIFYFPAHKVNCILKLGDFIDGKAFGDHLVQIFYFIDEANGAYRSEVT